MRGLFPPQVLNRLDAVNQLLAADPGPADEARRVCQGYAQVLQGCLGRSSHSRFDLSGLAVYADVQALVESLARCLAQQTEPTLLEWQTHLQAILAEYRASFEELAQAQSWLQAIRQVLDSAALPSAEAAGAGADTVARELAQVLGWLADQRELSEWQQSIRAHLWAVSERYWSGLFVCYELEGVPRTNNDLEGLFGTMRRRVRQQSGAKQVRGAIGRQGAWLVYPMEQDVAALEQLLARVSPERYQHERAQFEQRQARFRQRLRWRRNRAGVLEQLEAQWAALCANPTL
jgi:hypothetical protein